MKRVALVVGINRYPDLLDNQDKAQHLTTAATEADQLANLLRDSGGFEVYRLPQVEGEQRINPQGQVSKKELGEAIFRLFLPETGEVPETALLYFAGHGWQDVVEGQSQGYLMTSDSCPEAGDRGLPLQWLRKVLEKSQVRQQIVWLDCCHSGALFNFADQDLLTFFEKEQDRCFMAASREFEPSVSGVFTPKLLDGLDPSNQPDGVVSNVSLGAFLAEAMKDAPHHPMIRNPGGEILLTTQRGVRDHVCPYKGLAYFDFQGDDPQYFFGRTALTNELVRRVEVGSFLAVLGMSGSGKSSVVRAGLLHRLAAQGRRWTIYAPFTPGDHPLNSLRQAVGVELGQLEAVMRAAATERAIVVIDQFEEVFTLCRDEGERQGFLVGLLGAVERLAGKLCLVVVMRADFFGKCAERAYGGLAKKMEQHLVTVLPMEEGELREAIVYPAERVGVEIDRELVTQMIGDVAGSSGSLPLMQYALTQLWELKTLNRLRLADYTRLGGVTKALGNHADGVYGALSPEEQGVARGIFLALTRLGDGTEDTRQRVRQGDLVRSPGLRGVVEGVIQKLTDAKLLVTGEEVVAGKRVAVVNIVHETLIRNWGLLGQWLKDNRAALLRKQEIEDAAREWRDKGKGNDYLLQGKRLENAEDFQKRHTSIPLSGIAQSFVYESVKLRKRNHRFIAVGSVVGAVVLIFAGIAGVNWRGSEGQRQIVFARRLANQSDLIREQQPEFIERSVLLAVESMKRTRSQEGEEALRASLGLLPNVVNSFEYDGEARSISPDGKYLALVNENHLVVVNFETQEKLFEFTADSKISALNAFQNGVVFSPDSRYIAVVSSTHQKLHILDAKKGDIISIFQTDEPIADLSFSPDNRYIAIGGFDSAAWIFETQTGNQIAYFDYGWRIHKVLFSPDSKYLAVILDDFVRYYNEDQKQKVLSVYVNDIQSGNELWSQQKHTDISMRGHGGGIRDISFSPDGNFLATGGSDGKAIVWAVESGQQVLQVDHSNVVDGLVFSPNNQYFASGSVDGVRVLDITTQNTTTLFHSSQSGAYPLQFTDDNKSLITSSPGQESGTTVHVWNLEGNRETSRFKNASNFLWTLINQNQQYRFRTVEIQDELDQSTVQQNKATKSFGTTWDVAGNQAIIYINQPNRDVRTVIFSPDGKFLFTTGMFLERSLQKYENMKLWNPYNGAEILKINAPESYSFSTLDDPRYGEIEVQGDFRFSSDGQYIISERHEGFRSWNLTNGEEVFLDNFELFKDENISPNGKYHIKKDDHMLVITNSDNGQYSNYKISNIESSYVPLAFSLNSEYLAVASPDDNKITILDLEQFKIVKEIDITNIFSQEIRNFKFTPNENHLAINTGNILYIFDIQKESTIAHITDGNNYSGIFDISPDGKYLAVSQGDRVKIILLYPDDLLDEACKRLTRNLTQEEWLEYIPNDNYRKTCNNLP